MDNRGRRNFPRSTRDDRSRSRDKQRELEEESAMAAAEVTKGVAPVSESEAEAAKKEERKRRRERDKKEASKREREMAIKILRTPPPVAKQEPLSQGSSNYLGSPGDYGDGSQGSAQNHPPSQYKKTAQTKGSSLNSHLQETFKLEGEETPSGQHARKGSSLKKGEEAQFNTPWWGIIKDAKKSICYICGCPIVEKEVRGGKKIRGHSPEMEHVIVPGEFFMKFGTEFVAHPRQIAKKINKEQTIREYEGIHAYGSDGTVPLSDRIRDVKTQLDQHVNSSRVESGLSFPAKYGYPTGVDITVAYDKEFFVPQIKSYMVQFAYAHHICNQIKGHMPVLEGSDGLKFSDDGEYNKTISPFTHTIERYAEILVDVVRNIKKKPQAQIGKGQTDPYYQGFNDGRKCYIAAPKSDEYSEEIPDIYTCWFGTGKISPEQIENVKTRIIKNMLYHSALLRMTRRECTLQRLKHPYYIRNFTTLIPDDINDDISHLHSTTQLERENAINKKVNDLTEIVDDDLQSVQSFQNNEDDDNCSVSVFSQYEEIKNVIDYDDFFTKKKLLYKKIGLQLATTQTATDIVELNRFLETNNMGRVADLIASNVIYKAHQMMNTSSKPKAIGGKRTKRRRGRGKSKKKVTRKKRVKRRKTVKKIKRKRRRTRKR